MKDFRQLVAVLLILTLAGCVGLENETVTEARTQMLQGGDDEVVSPTSESSNLLSANLLSSNLLSSNLLSSNALAAGALAPGVYMLNTQASNGLETSAEGLELLRYLVRCSLAEGEVLVVPGANGATHLPGLLGLAPGWKFLALPLSGRRAVSSCLLAHVNAYAVSVPISVRFHGVDDVSPDEVARFSQYEATFFGNVFDPSLRMYVCMGDPAPDFNVAYPEHDTTRGDRLLRRCADVKAGSAQETECDFTYVGRCSDMCDVQNGGSYQQCWSNRSQGTRYNATTSVWLTRYDDAESVWASHYEDIYGP